jgi:hypothetical protein
LPEAVVVVAVAEITPMDKVNTAIKQTVAAQLADLDIPKAATAAEPVVAAVDNLVAAVDTSKVVTAVDTPAIAVMTPVH